MSLMFPRVAKNYAKKGFYPTDEGTLERILSYIAVNQPGHLKVLDPCCGEGVALKEIQHHFETEFDCEVNSYGVEIEHGRYVEAKEHLDIVINSDFFNCLIDHQSFDVMLFNPPYGELVGDRTKMVAGENRLEKAFFRKSVGLLKPNGIGVMILSYLQLDKNFAERIARAFDDIQVYRAVDPTYKQLVIFGRRVKSHSAKASVVDAICAVKEDINKVPLIPAASGENVYSVKCAGKKADIKFKTVRITPEIVTSEMERHNGMLWADFNSIFQTNSSEPERPLVKMSPWHCAMAVISGCTNGFITNEHGETLLLKGGCNKVIKSTIEVNEFEDENGTIEEKVEFHTEQYQAEIMGINFTPNSTGYGDVIYVR